MSTRSRANPGGAKVLEIMGDDVRPYRERKPPSNAITAQILTFPYSIVAVPRVTGAVRFERID